MDATTRAAHGVTLGEQVARAGRKAPDVVALRFEGRDRTYRELEDRVTRLARALAARGLVHGDRVAVLSRNRLEVFEVYLATIRLGCICVPVNFRLVPAEIAYVLAHSGARALVVDDALAGVAARVPAAGTAVRLVLAGPGDDGWPGAEPYEQVLAGTGAGPVEAAVGRDDPAFVMYTSGTTGRPKGAVLTHDNLLIHALALAVDSGNDPQDRRWLAGVPLFHIAGVSGTLPYLLLGRTTVVMPSGGFDPVDLVDVLERERISNCFLVPAQWQAVCAVPGIRERDLSALRRISWGAAPAPPSVLAAMAEVFPRAANQTSFGQTECSPVTCLLPGEDALRKPGSVGRPVSVVEARVVDERMEDVEPGEVGEIVYRGPTVTPGYWNDPVATAEAFAGGWFHSGDLVREDEDGYLYVVDRKKDMIISGGENIYCAEVEAVLDGHPGVREVALVGVPHPTWGETPLAVVVPVDPAAPPTLPELLVRCRELLAPYKQPRALAIVDALPRNASGKVVKTRLRELYAAG